MKKIKSNPTQAIIEFRNLTKYVNYSVDNYIERELLGGLYNLVNKHIDLKLEPFIESVNEMLLEDKEFRTKVLNKLVFEIRREIDFLNTIKTLNKKPIPEVENFSVVLYWVKQSRRVVNEGIPAYTKILSNVCSKIYSTTGNNRLKTELTVQSKIMQDKFFVILNLLQKEIYGRYINELENLYLTAVSYMKLYDGTSDIEVLETSIADEVKTEFKNISDYKYLNKLATDNNFIKVSQNGSHAQFKHSDGRLVTIPQGRSVGKGLSIKIQKDIETNRLTERLHLMGV